MNENDKLNLRKIEKDLNNERNIVCACCLKENFNTCAKPHYLILKVCYSLFCVLQIMQETDQKFKSNLDKIKNHEKNMTNVSFDITVFHAGFAPWLHFNFTADILNKSKELAFRDRCR